MQHVVDEQFVMQVFTIPKGVHGLLKNSNLRKPKPILFNRKRKAKNMPGIDFIIAFNVVNS